MLFDFPRAGDINRLRNEMERMFGERAGGTTPRVTEYPALNMWEDDDNLYVESEVPGMELEDFEIFVNDDNQLTLQGERKRPVGNTGTRHREERNFGRFSRMIQLPVKVNGDSTTAAYKAGVLLITMPKKEEAKPRRIVVAGQ
jgi:HSP20 family protein